MTKMSKVKRKYIFGINQTKKFKFDTRIRSRIIATIKNFLKENKFISRSNVSLFVVNKMLRVTNHEVPILNQLRENFGHIFTKRFLKETSNTPNPFETLEAQISSVI